MEVTDRIELALQEMPQLDYIELFSRAGLSQVSVELLLQYWSDQLPQVWDELRRKIRNIEHMLPPGVGVVPVAGANVVKAPVEGTRADGNSFKDYSSDLLFRRMRLTYNLRRKP